MKYKFLLQYKIKRVNTILEFASLGSSDQKLKDNFVPLCSIGESDTSILQSVLAFTFLNVVLKNGRG